MSGKKGAGMHQTIEMQLKEVSSGGQFGNSLIKEESEGHYVVESELKGVGYIIDGKWIYIATPHGRIKMLRKNAEIISREIIGVLRDVKDLNLGTFWRRQSCDERRNT